MARITIAAVVLCALAGAAHAEVNMNAVNNGPTAGVPGCSTWRVYLDSPEMVNALDCSFIGPMHQEFAYGGLSETPYVNSPGLTSTLRVKDSHIMLTTTSLASLRAFHETDDTGAITDKLAGWIDDGSGGFGGWNTALFGIHAQSPHLLFAQLIIPDGQYVTFAGLWAANGLAGLPPFSYQIGIPEPATLGLLSLGGLALLRRRR